MAEICLPIATACAVGGYVYALSIQNRPRCLSASEARSVYDSKAFNYCRLFRSREILARTRDGSGRDVRDIYKEACLDWDQAEISKVTRFIQEQPLLQTIAWKLIKMPDRMDFGFPYTIGDHVVLPQRMITSICNSYDPKGDFMTLVHESIHITQRAHPSIFDDYFERVLRFQKAPDLLIPDKIAATLITNPDGFDVWISTRSGKPYFYCLCLTDAGAVTKLAFPVVTNNGRLTLDAKAKPLSEFARYHGNIANCYHPAEIHAYSQAQVLTDSHYIEA